MKNLVVLNVVMATVALSSAVPALAANSCLPIDHTIPIHAKGIYFDEENVIAGQIPQKAAKNDRVLGDLRNLIDPNSDGVIVAGTSEVASGDLGGPADTVISKHTNRASVDLKISSRCAENDDSCTTADLEGSITINPDVLRIDAPRFLAGIGGVNAQNGQVNLDSVCVTGVAVIADKTSNYVKVLLYVNGTDHGYGIEALNTNRVKKVSPEAVEHLAGTPEAPAKGASVL